MSNGRSRRTDVCIFGTEVATGIRARNDVELCDTVPGRPALWIPVQQLNGQLTQNLLDWAGRVVFVTLRETGFEVQGEQVGVRPEFGPPEFLGLDQVPV